jgi:phosphatidylglycerol:prolipoprotein diacylglycerol transferase
MVFVNNLNPILLSMGPLQIRWYGILYALSVVLVYFYVRNEINKKRLHVSLDDFDMGYFWIIISMVLGARLFEVFVYHPGYFFANPSEIFMIWKGGLSFHGGLVGALLASWIWCRKKKVKFLQFADTIVVPAALVQAFVRLGNFFNSELVGRAFDGAWAVVYTAVDEIPRHPVQIYEIVYNLIVFGVLYSLRKKGLPYGSLFALFMILYSAFRFVVEFFKEPTATIIGMPTGQWLSIILFGFGIWLWFRVRKN